MYQRKGIILAGGLGTRLYPLTLAVSKQLLPVYDKPMIYYPLTILMYSGLKEILIIISADSEMQFKKVLGNGSQWGLKISYKVQQNPDGLAQAFILAEEFLDGSPSTLILGDNIFYGHGLPKLLKSTSEQKSGATIFAYHVNNPQNYGVLSFDKYGEVNNIIEKPLRPPSNYAVTGIYFVDETAPEKAKKIKPSKRGELEITSLLENYLSESKIHVQYLGRGHTWLDTGTHSSLLYASNFVNSISERQGLLIGSPDEVAYRLGYINKSQLLSNSHKFKNDHYGQYLRKLI